MNETRLATKTSNLDEDFNQAKTIVESFQQNTGIFCNFIALVMNKIQRVSALHRARVAGSR